MFHCVCVRGLAQKKQIHHIDHELILSLLWMKESNTVFQIIRNNPQQNEMK